ncbi:MAG: alpha/beta hydrolase [Nostoc sp. DedQUE08]|uniref:alpha/beta fold hydrolase n=1 Tax=Nostoc sp. DedQUE08 TaxID=3075393 RepID=UPI002AD3BC7A|nr:alpha/beta hydrolase [Nostoc sp. DedQUE08]MDZ8068517.1 alpha/beta hydrolase [Nostoc sp. DedQUE08]
MEMPIDNYINIEGINTRYWKVGEHGTPLILIHGAGASIDYWYKNIFILGQNHVVYALDWVGSGKTDKPEKTYNYDDLANFVIQFMDTIGVSNATVLGASAGGVIALKLALAFPKKVNKLVLIGSAGLGKAVGLGMRISSIPGIGEALNKPSLATTKFLIRQCAHYPENFLNDEFVNLVYQNLPLEVLKFQLRLFRTTANFWGMKPEFLKNICDFLTQIQAPTLIIWGKQDQVIPVSYAESTASKIPDSKLHLFNNCGHWPYLEYPDDFNHLVLEFLK